MLVDYVAAGFDADAFWRSTPREIALHMRGAARREERAHTLRAWHAWHVAALGRVERMPSLEAMTGQRRRTMTDAELNAIGRALWIDRGGDPAAWDREADRVARQRALDRSLVGGRA